MHPIRKREMGDTTLSYAVGNKGAELSLADLPSPHREHLLNWGPAATAAGLPSPSSLRDATSPKVRGFGYTGKFAFSKKLSLWESWREAPERARMLAERLRPGLAGANDRADFRKPQSKLTRCVLVRVLALSVIASRCHLSQSERPWQSVKFPVYTLRPAAAKRAVRRCAETFRLCQGLPLWGSWREAPERASPAEAAQGVGLDSANDGADFAPV